MGRTLLVVRNVLKAWLLLLATVAVFAGTGWLIGGLRGLEIFVFCGLLLALAGYYLPWHAADLRAFDDLLRSYRQLSLTDQVAVRTRLLWHILGIEAAESG